MPTSKPKQATEALSFQKPRQSGTGGCSLQQGGVGLTGFWIRTIIKVTIIRKPCYLLFTGFLIRA